MSSQEDALYFDYTDGPSAGSITVEEEVYIPDWVFAATNKGIDLQWDLYDSGASHHMSPCRGDFVNFREIPMKSLTVANSESFVATGTGDMIITTPHGEERIKIQLTHILYTPAVGFTLVSIGHIDDTGFYSTFGGGQCEIRAPDGRLIGKIPKTGGVYRSPHASAISMGLVGIQQVSLKDLHRWMGHINVCAVKDLVKHGVIDGIVLTGDIQDFECRACQIAKGCRKSIPKIREGGRATKFGGEVHSDLWGPACKPTFGSRIYYISFMDDWSQWTTVYLLTNKSDAFNTYKSFVAWVETQMEKKIKVLHSDHGGEDMSEEFTTFLDRKGTERKLTVHDTPQENGVAERLN